MNDKTIASNEAAAAAELPTAEETVQEDTVQEETVPQEPVEQASRSEAAAAPRQAVAWWALLLALVAGGISVWSAWQARDTHGQSAELRETLARRLSEGEQLAAEARGVVRQQQEVLASLQGKLGALESKVETAEGHAAALDTLYKEFSRSREDRVAAEVQQAVSLASQQLQLAGNVEVALVALNQADARLAAHDRGQYAPLRRALARDIEALKLQQVLDVPGLGLRLENLLARIDRMPLAFAGELPTSAAMTAPPAEDSAEGSAADWMDRSLAVANKVVSDVWREVSGLVRLERLDQEEPALLAPDQSTFLRENLKIRLLTARLALLAHDGRTYAADLAQARAWVERFFDLDDDGVRVALAELDELSKVSLSRELPTLTETFAALRMIQVDAAAPPLPVSEDASPALESGSAEPAAASAGPAAAGQDEAERSEPSSENDDETPPQGDVESQ